MKTSITKRYMLNYRQMTQKVYAMINLMFIFIINIRGENERRIAQETQTQETDTSNWPIFKANPIFNTDSLQYCHFYQNSDVYYFNTDNDEYFALSLGTCGFNVFNLQNPYNPSLEVNFPLQNGKINMFQFDDFRNLLWITQSEGNIYTIQVDKKPFNVELSFQTNGSVKSYFVDFIPNLNNTILIICQNQIQIFSNQQGINNRDISSFKYYKSIILNNSGEVSRIQFINSLLFVGSQLQGLQIYKVEQIQTLNISISFIKSFLPNNFVLKDFQISQKKIIYLQQNFGGIFSFNASDYINNGDDNSCKNIPLIENKSHSQRGGTMYITKDQNYLITQYFTYGIQIFDISSTKLRNFQTIDYEGETVSLALNRKETLIILSGTSKIQIYLRDRVKLALDKPNILLSIIQSTDQTFYRDSSYFVFEQDCYLDNKRNLLYITRSTFGITVFKKFPQGILKIANKLEEGVKGQGIGEFKFFLDSTLAYVAKGINGLSIIDFTDPEQPVYKQNNLKFGQTGNFQFLDCNQFLSLCSITLSRGGTIFLDISNLLNPLFMSVLPVSQTSYLAHIGVCFMNNQKIAFISIDSYGVYIINLNSPKNPVIISSINLSNGSGAMQQFNQYHFYFIEFLIKFKTLSMFFYSLYIFFKFNFIQQNLIFMKFQLFYNSVTKDDNYMIAASSYRGISIIDIRDLKNLKIISTVSLKGRLINLVFMSNQKYLVVPTAELPSIYLIDIQDKQNPVLLQTYKRKTTEGFLQICMDPYEKEIFITTGRFLIQTNFKNQVIFHKLIYQLKPIPRSNEKIIQDIDPSSPLFIGQIVNLRVFPLNIDNAVSIKKVMIYENFILQPLKSWMVFLSEQNLLQLTIVKDALQQDKQGQYIQTSLSIVFQSHIALDSSSFINSFLNINSTISLKILAECQRQGFIDQFYIVRENFDFDAQIQFNFENVFDSNQLASLTDENKRDTINAIKFVFRNSIVYYPIEVIVAPSIQFDLKNSELNYISSNQDSVVIYIRVNKDLGKFVNKNYPGILSIISSQQDEIKLEGNPYKLNQVLQQKIKFFSTSPPEDINFSIIVQDSINYDIEKQISYKDAFFISEQSKIKLLNELTIQEDFSRKFDESSIYIKERFSYQIPIEIFDCEDRQQLEFKIRIKDSEGKYEQIPQNYWLQFSEKERVLNGLPSEKEFYENIVLEVKITDNYSYITQEFQIYVKKIPFIYMIQILIQIIGPILGVLGFWKYKFILINFLQQKQYSYQKEFIKVGKSYSKQILLNNWNIKVSNQILDYFKEVFSNKDLMKQINLYKQQTIYCDTYINRLKNVSQNINSPQNSQNGLLVIQKFDEVLNEIVENSEQQNKQMKCNFMLTNSCNKDFDDSTQRKVTIENLMPKNKKKRLTRQLQQQIKKVNQSQIDQSKFQEQYSRSDTRQTQKSVDQPNQLWLFDLYGNINYEEIIQLLLSNNANQKDKKNTFTDEIIQHLNNKNSLIRQTFESFLAEFILQKDQFQYNIFKELYNQSQIPKKNPQWYSLYCKVQENIENIHNNPLPTVSFDEQLFESKIKNLLFDQNQNQITGNEFEKLPFSLNLVKETIKAYALGFISNSAQLKPISTGESLHIENYNIKQIISYSQKFDNQLQTIKRGLKSSCNKNLSKEFIEKPLVDNYKLPSWITTVEIINSNLLIIGNPQNKDIGRVYFYIYNKQNIIIRAFEIEIVENLDQNYLYQGNQSNHLFIKQNNSDVKCNNCIEKQRQCIGNNYEKETPNAIKDFILLESESKCEEYRKPHLNQFTL